MDAEKGVEWLQNNLFDCCEPLFNTPWILDIDTTVKPLFSDIKKVRRLATILKNLGVLRTLTTPI
ncbi:MAG: hypothetical protein U5M23_01560 [Marinagarivorans sp.]|nr:hypothetical protein [Marinagarivorans sp.]